MAKINTYSSVDDLQNFTPAEKAAFLAGAKCLASGPKNGNTVAANVPFSEFGGYQIFTGSIDLTDMSDTEHLPAPGEVYAALTDGKDVQLHLTTTLGFGDDDRLPGVAVFKYHTDLKPDSDADCYTFVYEWVDSIYFLMLTKPSGSDECVWASVPRLPFSVTLLSVIQKRQVWALFTDGHYSVQGKKFELYGTTYPEDTGCSDGGITLISAASTDYPLDGFKIKTRGYYRITLTLNIRSASSSAVNIPLLFGVAHEYTDGDVRPIDYASMTLSTSSQSESHIVHMHAVTNLYADDVIAPFLSANPMPEPFDQLNDSVNVELVSITFEQLSTHL